MVGQRMFSIVASIALGVAVLFSAISLALPVVEDHGIEYGWQSMTTPGFQSAFGSFDSQEIAYDDLDDRDGAGQLKAGFPLLLVGLITGVVAIGLVWVPGTLGRILGLVGTVASGAMLVIAPIMIASGASTMTDGEVTAGDGTAGFFIPIVGAAVALIGILVAWLATPRDPMATAISG